MKYILFVLLVLMVLSCRQLTSGKIVDKHYRPGYTTVGFHRIGKNTYPYTDYHSPTYMLRVQGYNEKKEPVTEWWYVTSGTYDKYQIGNQISNQTPDY